MDTRRLTTCLVLLLASAPIAAQSQATQPKSAAEYLPATVVAYAEMPDPAAFVDLALNHPVRQQLEGVDAIRAAYDTPQFLQIKAAVAVIEAQLGKTWPMVIKSAAAGGLAVAIDAPTQGAAVLITAKDADTPLELVNLFVKLARADSVEKNKPDPIEIKDYRGLPVHRVAQARVVVLDNSLLITNNPALGQRIVDMHLDKVADTLAASKLYRQARDLVEAKSTVWGYVDVAALRQGGIAKALFTGRTDNPVAELLVGGILANLQETPLATFSLALTDAQLSVQVATPHNPDWVGEERDYFFGPKGQGQAPELLHVDGELFTLATYRDVSQMWLRAGDLFDDNVNDQLAQADSNLATLFSGKDFAEDILGAVSPGIQLVVARQDFPQGDQQPAIKLPAFALVTTLKNPETMRPELRRTFQSLIGFLNVLGAMNGQPQLDLDMDKNGDRQLFMATYVPEKDADTTRLPINFNFSPSVGFVGDRFVVASTKSLADEVLQRLGGNPGKPKTPTNTAARADLAGLHQILRDNRGTLVAQNMLSEGHTKEEAEHEIEALLNILQTAQSAGLRLTSHDGELRLALELTFTPTETSSPSP